MSPARDQIEISLKHFRTTRQRQDLGSIKKMVSLYFENLLSER